MKKLFLLAIVAFMSIGASAQLISSSTVTYKKAEKNGYSRLGISYNSLKLEDLSLNGVSLDWTKGISLSSSMPLYIETGLGATYAFGSEDYDYDYSEDSKFLYLTVPINLTYKFDVAEGIKIAPFAGVYLQGNILGKTEDDYDDYDWFDSDEVDGTRFNYGFQIGANAEFGKFYVGLSYGMALNEIMEDVKQNTFKATIGLVF